MREWREGHSRQSFRVDVIRKALYLAVLSRIRAERDDKDTHCYKITRGRAAIIKAYLLRNRPDLNMKGEDFVGLNEECRDIAYVLGREFSVLEAIRGGGE